MYLLIFMAAVRFANAGTAALPFFRFRRLLTASLRASCCNSKNNEKRPAFLQKLKKTKTNKNKNGAENRFILSFF
jgi:hypothetical protein